MIRAEVSSGETTTAVQCGVQAGSGATGREWKGAGRGGRELGIRGDMLRKWRQFAMAVHPREAFPGNGKPTSQDEEVRQLRREVAQHGFGIAQCTKELSG
jgi:hypothetical protein